MKKVIYIPATNNYHHTFIAVDQLNKTTTNKEDLKVVIVNNKSKFPYNLSELVIRYKNIEVIENKENLGFYYPMKQVRQKYPEAEIIIACHNDLWIYETGWDVKLEEVFKDKLIGLVGAAGSDYLDETGHWGGHMRGNFQGLVGQTNYGIKQLVGNMPAVVVDSLLMAFRSELIDKLKISHDDYIVHWLDRDLSLQIINLGYRIMACGLLIEHLGGQTVILPEYETFSESWAKKHDLDKDKDPDEAIYDYLQEKFLKRYKKQLPIRVKPNWEIVHI